MNTSRYEGKYVSKHIGKTLRFPEQWLYVLLTVTTVCAYFIRSTYLAVIACDDEQIGTHTVEKRWSSFQCCRDSTTSADGMARHIHTAFLRKHWFRVLLRPLKVYFRSARHVSNFCHTCTIVISLILITIIRRNVFTLSSESLSSSTMSTASSFLHRLEPHPRHDYTTPTMIANTPGQRTATVKYSVV